MPIQVWGRGNREGSGGGGWRRKNRKTYRRGNLGHGAGGIGGGVLERLRGRTWGPANAWRTVSLRQPPPARVSCPRTVLPLSSPGLEVSGGRGSERRAPGALTRGKGGQERRGLRAGRERSLRPREGLLSGGRAPESGGRVSPSWSVEAPGPSSPGRPHPRCRCQR